jgi:hypothetical protein
MTYLLMRGLLFWHAIGVAVDGQTPSRHSAGASAAAVRDHRERTCTLR